MWGATRSCLPKPFSNSLWPCPLDRAAPPVHRSFSASTGVTVLCRGYRREQLATYADTAPAWKVGRRAWWMLTSP